MFSPVTANHTIRHFREQHLRDRRVGRRPRHGIAPSGITNVDSGGNRTYTITPDARYQVAAVGDSVSVGAVANVHVHQRDGQPHDTTVTFGIPCPGTIDPAIAHPPGLSFGDPGFAEGGRGPFNKDGAKCGAVDYTFTNNILSDNSVVLTWNTASQPGAAFWYTVTWKPEYVSPITGMPSRTTKVAWFVGGSLITPVAGRACIAGILDGDSPIQHYLPVPYGTLIDPIGPGDLTIHIAVTSATTPDTPFPIQIGLERLVVVTKVDSTHWTVTRGNGRTPGPARMQLGRVS